MTRFLETTSAFLSGLMMLFQTKLAQTESICDPVISKKDPLFLPGLHSLSIDVRDIVTHDLVFHFGRFLFSFQYWRGDMH